jgi:hypothetical protein
MKSTVSRSKWLLAATFATSVCVNVYAGEVTTGGSGAIKPSSAPPPTQSIVSKIVALLTPAPRPPGEVGVGGSGRTKP